MAFPKKHTWLIRRLIHRLAHKLMGTLLRTPLLYSPYKPVALLKKLRLLVSNLSFNVPIASGCMGWDRCIGSILFAALNVL